MRCLAFLRVAKHPSVRRCNSEFDHDDLSVLCSHWSSTLRIRFFQWVCQERGGAPCPFNHYFHYLLLLSALPYKVKVCQAHFREEGQEEPVTVTILETPVWLHFCPAHRSRCSFICHFVSWVAACLIFASFAAYECSLGFFSSSGVDMQSERKCDQIRALSILKFFLLKEKLPWVSPPFPVWSNACTSVLHLHYQRCVCWAGRCRGAASSAGFGSPFLPYD